MTQAHTLRVLCELNLFPLCMPLGKVEKSHFSMPKTSILSELRWREGEGPEDGSG